MIGIISLANSLTGIGLSSPKIFSIINPVLFQIYPELKFCAVNIYYTVAKDIKIT